MGHTLLVLGIYLLTVARITRLVNSDRVLDGFRLAVIRRVHAENRSDSERERWSKFAYWLGCPWCAGLWFSLTTAWVPTLLLGWSWFWSIPLALATSHLIGRESTLLERDDIEIQDVRA